MALDWYAQADDGSVWYFGEDVFNYEDGKVADTKGTWMASDDDTGRDDHAGQAAVGNVYRPENAPGGGVRGGARREGRPDLAGPSGKISGAIEVNELHMDGTREGKIFAPGYGEFSTGNPGGDLEAVSLASPTDSGKVRRPPSSRRCHGASAGSSMRPPADGCRRSRGKPARRSVRRGSGAHQGNSATDGFADDGSTSTRSTARSARSDWEAVQWAALRIAQNELDLRLLYATVIDVDLARLKLWTRQLPVDVAAGDSGLVLANVAALERVWERTKHGVEPQHRLTPRWSCTRPPTPKT